MILILLQHKFRIGLNIRQMKFRLLLLKDGKLIIMEKKFLREQNNLLINNLYKLGLAIKKNGLLLDITLNLIMMKIFMKKELMLIKNRVFRIMLMQLQHIKQQLLGLLMFQI
jgi:hypothetical protein